MQSKNDQDSERRASDWVTMQEKSRRIKEEAEKLGKHGEERRQYIAEHRHKPNR
jgi:hypothetical protein